MGTLVSTVLFAAHLLHGNRGVPAYRTYRQSSGRSILLGLEILVAADIMRTVATEPTFRSVGVLAIIVLIRAFLSISLEVELEGRFPWQAPPSDSPASPAPTKSDGS